MTDQLGTLLRRLRTESGLTQEQAAERSGVSVRTIRRLETGKSTDHRLGTLNLLADALGAGAEERLWLAAALAGPQAASDAGPPASAHVPVPLPDWLADAAEELAREVRRRWRREEEQRRVHDPFPLPVRWEQASARLTDHSENIQRLAPGAAPRSVDLSGDLRNVAEVYRRIPSGRLLILGRAGSGKSILTIRFVLDFLGDRSGPEPVPVIFSVGSWDPTATAVRDWLVDRLLRDHPHLARRVPNGSTLAAALVDADLILPVLDGFDEIAEGLRCEALAALNGASLPLVLTSRYGEFAEAVHSAGAPLVWAAGIELTDLTLDDLAAYLPRTARSIAPGDGEGERRGDTAVAWDLVMEELWKQETPASVNLARVLSTPLMVALARTMYSDAPDRDPAELLDPAQFSGESSLEEHLLAGFVPTVYRRRAPERATGDDRRRHRNRDPEQARRWLGYLAHHLGQSGRDRQDLAWWQIGDSLRRPTRIIAVALATALCVSVSQWLFGLLDPQLVPGGEVLLQAALVGPIVGLACGLAYGIMAAFGGGGFEPVRVRLRLPGTHGSIGRRPVHATLARFGLFLLGGFAGGIGIGGVVSLERVLEYRLSFTSTVAIDGTLLNLLFFGLVFGLACGLVFGLMATFEAPLDITSAATPTALLSANRATVSRQVLVLVPMLALTTAFEGRLIVDLLHGGLLGRPLYWNLGDELFVGAISGFGGAFVYALSCTAWGQWVILSRIWLPLTGRLPWDTAAFLDDAYQRGVLRRTGAVYQFRHIRLQHHLADSFHRQQATHVPARFTARP